MSVQAEMTWQNLHAKKLSTPTTAIGKIQPGERIFLSSGSAAPAGLVSHLIEDGVSLGDNEVIHLLTLGDAPYAQPRFEGVFRHNALFIGPNVRRAVVEGRVDYTPVFLSEIPRLIRKRQIPIEVAIISVTPQADGGAGLRRPAGRPDATRWATRWKSGPRATHALCGYRSGVLFYAGRLPRASRVPPRHRVAERSLHHPPSIASTKP